MVGKYPSTGQFRNCISTFQWNQKHLNESINDVPYTGTVKLHGTNGSFVKESADSDFIVMSKENILSAESDNYNFFWVYSSSSNREIINKLFIDIAETYKKIFYEDIKYPIRISGEFAGRNIQSGVAISEVERFFAIFAISCGNERDCWLNIEDFKDIRNVEGRIFNICDFGIYKINIDFTNPQLIQNKLTEYTTQVENECPAGKYFGVTGVGEGIVWSPNWPKFGPEYRFKVKGKKHSSSKVKVLAEVDVEKIKSINEFISYACTENRMNQALTEIGLSQDTIGTFIKWIITDILKEESDTMQANGITPKDLGKYVASTAREFYINKLNEI